MSELKFTRGPWKVSTHKYLSGKRLEIRSEEYNQWIATLSANFALDEANASLIAAAPEMYDLLQKVVNLEVLTGYWDMKNNCSLRESIQKLLKKARGEE